MSLLVKHVMDVDMSLWMPLVPYFRADSRFSVEHLARKQFRRKGSSYDIISCFNLSCSNGLNCFLSQKGGDGGHGDRAQKQMGLYGEDR